MTTTRVKARAMQSETDTPQPVQSTAVDLTEEGSLVPWHFLKGDLVKEERNTKHPSRYTEKSESRYQGARWCRRQGGS